MSLRLPAGYLLPAFYAQYTAVPLALIGLAFTLARIFDAVTDPLIGHLSDRTHTRIGQRKPWIAAGGALAMVSAFFLFTPAADASWIYLAIWAMLLTLAWTMMEIPHAAWGKELTPDYKERARIFTYRSAAGMTGALMVITLPFWPIFPTAGYTREVMFAIGVALSLLIPLGILISVIWGPLGSRAAPETTHFWSMLPSVFRNKPFRLFGLVALLAGLGSGMYGPLYFLYLSTHLGFADSVGYNLLVVFIGILMGLPLWLAAMKRFGKHRAWAVSSGLYAIVLPVLPLFPQGEAAFWPVIAFGFFHGLSQGGVEAGAPAVLGDVVDYDSLKTGIDRTGFYYAAHAILLKGSAAIGTGIGFALIGLFGFDAGAANTGSALFGIEFAMAYLPCALMLLASVLAWFFPLDERRQRIVRTRLEILADR